MMHDRKLAVVRATAVLAIVTMGACALSNPPTDETPPTGGLPEGVSASPPQTSTGGGTVTSPTPVTPDLMPAPSGQPMGNFVAERGPRVESALPDSATRVLAARLDSVIAPASTDLTRLPIPVARGLIRSISATLAGARSPRTLAVAAELDSLHALLGANPVDGGAVGRSLQRVAARSQAAAPAAGVLSARVARLADQLNDAGNKLAR